MPAILIGGEKGGTGKSTIVVNLAVMSKLMGYDTIIIDTDKQATSARFIQGRKEFASRPTPFCVQVVGKHLNTEIEDLCSKYQVVIIDAGGQDSTELRAAMGSPSVKKMFTPLSPSHFDLETLSTMDDIIYTAQCFNHELDAYVIYSKAPTHPKMQCLQDAIEFSKEFENVKLANSILKFRAAPYHYAANSFRAIVEFEVDAYKNKPKWQKNSSDLKASIELCDLYAEVFEEQFEGEVISLINSINLDSTG